MKLDKECPSVLLFMKERETEGARTDQSVNTMVHTQFTRLSCHHIRSAQGRNCTKHELIAYVIVHLFVPSLSVFRSPCLVSFQIWIEIIVTL